MKKILLITAGLIFALLPALMAQQGEEKKIVLIREYLINNDSYMIVARGYPNPTMETTSEVRKKLSAQEAATLNAQILAKERFKAEVDVTKGKVMKFIATETYADVWYKITYPNIKRMKIKK